MLVFLLKRFEIMLVLRGKGPEALVTRVGADIIEEFFRRLIILP